jgi:hypothetical protein
VRHAQLGSRDPHLRGQGAAGRSSCTRRASTNVAAAGTSAFTRTARLCSRDAASSLVNRWKGIFNLPLSIRKTVKRSSTTLTSLATGRIRFIIPRRPNDCPQIPSRLRWLGECRLGYLKRRPLGVPVNYSSNDFVRSCAAIIGVVLGSRAPREMTLACYQKARLPPRARGNVCSDRADEFVS